MAGKFARGTEKEPSPEPPVKNVAKVDAMLASDEDDTLNIISKQSKKMSKMEPKSVTKQVTKSGPLPTEAHRPDQEQHRPILEQARPTLDHHRPNLDHRPDLDTINNLNDEVIQLKQQVHEQQTRNIEKMQTQQDTSHVLDQARHNANLAERSRLEEVQKCTARIRDSDLEHKSHINRLKQTHMETIQLLKDEKDAKLQRLKVNNHLVSWLAQKWRGNPVSHSKVPAVFFQKPDPIVIKRPCIPNQN